MENINELITYDVTESQLAKLREDYLPLIVTGPEDKQGYEVVKTARIKIKGLRVSVEKRRKELKQESLDFGRLVDHRARTITEGLEVIEGHLQAQQDIVDKEKERQRLLAEQAAKEKLQSRMSALQDCHAALRIDQVEGLSDMDFDSLLTTSQQAFNAAKIEQERKDQELAALAAERLIQQAKIAEQEADAKRLRDELIEKQKQELAEQNRRIAEAEAAKQKEIAAIEAAKTAELAAKQREIDAAEAIRKAEVLAQQQKDAQIAREKAIAEAKAKKAAKNKALFEQVKNNFPTIEQCWGEIVRLMEEKESGR